MPFIQIDANAPLNNNFTILMNVWSKPKASIIWNKNTHETLSYALAYPSLSIQ